MKLLFKIILPSMVVLLMSMVIIVNTNDQLDRSITEPDVLFSVSYQPNPMPECMTLVEMTQVVTTWINSDGQNHSDYEIDKIAERWIFDDIPGVDCKVNWDKTHIALQKMRERN